MYSIYRITSPSGKYYIGLTRQTVSARWSQHSRIAGMDKEGIWWRLSVEKMQERKRPCEILR